MSSDYGSASVHRTVLEAVRQAIERDERGALALVVETAGSTYVRPGAMAWFGTASRRGWLSGGCLEAEIAGHAAQSVCSGAVRWLELDSRDDAELLGGSSPGCRGRLRLALLPLRSVPELAALLGEWFARVTSLRVTLTDQGCLAIDVGGRAVEVHVDAAKPAWEGEASAWSFEYGELPRVAVLGAGPETEHLLPMLRSVGFRTLLVERRDRWAGLRHFADRWIDASPMEAMRDEEVARAGAALVMHHHFEFDREALQTLSHFTHGYVGLLGPNRRREDLFSLLHPCDRQSLAPRLRSPAGLDLGGQGAEAIAMSIAAQLQAWRHGR